jgi:glycine hydroxymethyltransferase
VTTRGFSLADCQELAEIICDVLDHVGDGAAETRAMEATLALCQKHPVYYQ